MKYNSEKSQNNENTFLGGIFFELSSV